MNTPVETEGLDPELPTPKTAWDVVFAAVITRVVQAPAVFYSDKESKAEALTDFIAELKSDHGASEIKVLRFEQRPVDEVAKVIH